MAKTPTKKAEKAKKQDNAPANRIARLNRTLKEQPENKQVVTALTSTRMHRATPKVPIWSSSWKAIAALYRKVNGRFDPKIMSSNAEMANDALRAYNPNKLPDVLKVRNPFSIGTQLAFKSGMGNTVTYK